MQLLSPAAHNATKKLRQVGLTCVQPSMIVPRARVYVLLACAFNIRITRLSSPYCFLYIHGQRTNFRPAAKETRLEVPRQYKVAKKIGTIFVRLNFTKY